MTCITSMYRATPVLLVAGMSSNPRFLQVVDASPGAVWTEERRLCAIVESDQTSPEEKYQALVDLAFLSGVFVRGLQDVA